MIEPWMASIGMVWVIGLMVVFVRRHHHQQQAFADDIANYRDVVFVGAGRFHKKYEVQTIGRLHKAYLGPEMGWQQNKRLWQIMVPDLRLSTSTSLRLSFEGYAGAYREKLGLHDIQVGNDVFDKRFTIRGSHTAVVRAVLAGPAVQQAITRLFEDSLAVVRFEVSDDGLAVSVKRLNMDASTARGLLIAVRAIAVLLDDAIPSDLPQREPLLLDDGSDALIVGSDSGMPVGVKGR